MTAIYTVVRGTLVAGLAAVFVLAGGCEQMGEREGTPMPGTNGDAREMEPGDADTAAQDTAAMDTGNGTMNGDTGDMMNGDTADTMNGDDALFDGDAGENSRTTATVSSVSSDDSTIVITDTITVDPGTSISMNGSDLSLEQLPQGEEISVQYRTENGKKVATEITEARKPEAQPQDQQQDETQY